MRRIIIFGLAVLLFTSCSDNNTDLKVMTYNIRYDNPSDGINIWDNRKESVLNLINDNDPIIVGIQEALSHQIKYLSNNSKYSFIGKGRDDGKEAGEYSPILYNSSKVELIDNGMFWLSEHPEKVSLGWDACCKRVVTWGKFSFNGKELYFFNTHFDFLGVIAREKSATLLKNKVKKMAGDLPVIITGDFNLTEDSEPYAILTSKDDDLSFSDSFHTSLNKTFDELHTFRGFSINPPDDFETKIDYIFYRNNVEAVSYNLDSSNNNGYYYSDHVPVIVSILIK